MSRKPSKEASRGFSTPTSDQRKKRERAETLEAPEKREEWMKGKDFHRLAIHLISKGVEESQIVRGFAYDSSNFADGLRERVLENNPEYASRVALSLGGLHGEQHWEMRYRCAELEIPLAIQILSVTGLESVQAWEFREQGLLTFSLQTIDAVLQSLVGLNSERAWKLRKKYWDKGGHDEALLQSLGGMASDEVDIFALEITQRSGLSLLPIFIGRRDHSADNFFAKLAQNPASEDMRSSLLGQALAGNPSQDTWTIRERLQKEGNLPVLAQSIMGLTSEQSWKVRAFLASTAKGRVALARTIYASYRLPEGAVERVL